MKKSFLIIFLCLILLICIVSCDADKNIDTQFEESSENNEEIVDNSTSEGNTTEENTTEEVTTEEVTTEEVTTEEVITITYLDEDVLSEFFAAIQEDGQNESKIHLYYTYQDEYYECKNSGLYEKERWKAPLIIITVACDYDRAADEAWYQNCPDKQYKTLNQAFFYEYCSELSGEYFVPLGILPALYFDYVHDAATLNDAIDAFNVDYSVVKTLASLDYVTEIGIEYWYPVPWVYITE